MKVYPTDHIRNLAVVGHGDAGKTQLLSSLLYVSGATPRWGKVDEGTTVTDYEEDSIARKVTLNTALAHCEWRDHKINFIDTPGYAAFVTHARPALRVADCAIVPFTLPIGQEASFRGVVDIVHMKAYEFKDGRAKEIDIPADGRDLVDKERKRLIEVIAESDDALMEKYFETDTLPEEDIVAGIPRAIAASRLCPVFAASSSTLVGLSNVLDGIIDYAPAPNTHEAEHGRTAAEADGGQPATRKYDASEPFSAYVFRTVADPFAGRINVLKVVSGHVKADATVQNTSRGTPERLGALHSMQGKQLDKIEEANAGDIIACVKLNETQTGDTLSDKAAPILYPSVEYPEAAIAFAIEPKSRQDEEKISVALHKILEEDPALHFTRDAQTKEFLLSGSGQLHVETVVEKLKNRYHVEVALHPPKVPYK